MTKQVQAYLAALLFSIVIGFSFLFVKISLTVASTLDILAHRFTAAFLFILIPLLLGKVKLNISRKSMLTSLPIALFHPILYFSLQVLGLVYISSSEAGILQATIPIFTVLLATIFLKEKSTGKQLISICLSVIGIIYIFIMNGLNVELFNFQGALFILLSSLSFSIYNILARKLTKDLSLYALTFWMTLSGCVIFNILALGYHLINQSLAQFFTPLASVPFLSSILYLGILSTVCTVFLSNFALTYIEASKMGVFTNLSTLITILAGVVFLQESFRYYHVLGTILILLGVIGTNYFGRRVPSEEKQEEKEKEMEVRG